MQRVTPNPLHFENANSRPTYFTVHKVAKAHECSIGEGIRAGILYHCFAMSRHSQFYESGKDFVSTPEGLLGDEGHGYWMASVIREVAPRCRIWALNVASHDSKTFAQALAYAIDWAKDNGINVLTCSHEKYVYDALRAEVDASVERAINEGIVVCFLHYDHECNIIPYGCFPYTNL